MTAIPTEAGPDTVCVCGHWYEEHVGPADGEPAICEGCYAGGAPDGEDSYAIHGFDFDPEGNTPAMIADRGGDPFLWPEWVKEAFREEARA